MRTSRVLLCVCAGLAIIVSGCVRQSTKLDQAKQLTVQAQSARVSPSSCPSEINSTASEGLAQVNLPPSQTCQPQDKDGFPIPDPQCTPGAINPTLTLDVMMSSTFRTGCVRNNATTEDQKAETYSWYGSQKPANNTGATQYCELDHLVPLVIGGADTLDNIWPQCGPDQVTLNERFFKQKDCVETYLAVQVRAGEIPLEAAQQGIASDWTQYLDAAKKAKCHGASQADSVD